MRLVLVFCGAPVQLRVLPCPCLKKKESHDIFPSIRPSPQPVMEAPRTRDSYSIHA